MLGVYMPLIVISALCASRYMDNLSGARNDRGALRDVARQRHTWMIAVLYVGTFGSFIGFSFAFGQVLQVQFKDIFDTPVKAAYITFLGPLLGSLMRPVGGALADKHGGAKVTALTFIAMIVGGSVIVAASASDTLWLFIAGFVSLFILTGLGNGSVYKMIPTIFRSQAQAALAAGEPADDVERVARRRSRALIGLTGAIGSFGGVLVNLTLRQSFLDTGSGTRAYAGFIAFYAVCLALTWRVYLRPANSELQGV
jgi:MFS transporter, NNP family, nitrate/nitrite transporter